MTDGMLNRTRLRKYQCEVKYLHMLSSIMVPEDPGIPSELESTHDFLLELLPLIMPYIHNAKIRSGHGRTLALYSFIIEDSC